MKYRIDYLAGRLVRRTLPEAIADKFLSRRANPVERLYNGEGNPSTSYAYLNAISSTNVRDKLYSGGDLVAIEAGTGGYNPISAPLMLAGISRLILLEPYIESPFDTKRLKERFQRFLTLAESDANFPLARSAQHEAFQNAEISVGDITGTISVIPRFWESTGLENSSVDFIFSASVLEHLRNPQAVISECARILKPGGYMINVVDMRDHYFKYPMEMLKFSPRIWKVLTTTSGGAGYQNRLRGSEWLNLLQQGGFSNTVHANIVASESALKDEFPKFHPHFRSMEIADLEVLHATIISQLAV